MNAQENVPLVATIVSDDDRLDFYPANFGKYFSAAETMLYSLSRRYVKEYDGGYWEFYTTTNGAFFAALKTSEAQHVVVPDNYTSEHMSAEAAGITLMLFVLGRFANARIPSHEAERFTDSFHKLRFFACRHAEAQAILTAID